MTGSVYNVQYNSLHVLEPKVALPCSQEPTSGLCPEPDKSSVCPLILFL